MARYEQEVKHDVFGFGEPNTLISQHFTGDTFLKGLVPEDDGIDVSVASVNFAPSVRDNWHLHHDGFQIILVTSGEGWGQIDGEPARSLKPGDVMVFRNDVKHWHGAKKDSWFTHIAITKGTAQWFETVDDEYYSKL
ncbi:cupin domain-containing protein [Bifidobacterium psychraerophilum]|uniref:cupin domain-containing protein n=1 Tax=Bifidobacterium psychraerophilum TaxID=218140 RepID=UPI0039EC0123